MADTRTTRRKRRNLFGLMTLISVLISLGIGSYDYWSAGELLRQEFDRTIQGISKRLPQSLEKPIFLVDQGLIRRLVVLEMEIQKEIEAVIIREADGETLFMRFGRDAQWQPVASEPPDARVPIPSGTARTIQKEIKVEDMLLGNLEMIFTDREVRDSLNGILKTAFVKSLLFCLLLIYILYKLMEHYFLKPIAETVAILESVESEVGHFSETILTASQSTAKSVSEQAASLQQTAASLEELAAVVRDNVDHADQADRLMGEAEGMVTSAGESVSALTESMSAMLKASREISEIVKTANVIAFQTNLLAINASVEAVRAGSHGAGFAVVADEVRNLAVRAATSARETARLIESTTEKIEDGHAIALTAHETFENVAEAVLKGNACMDQIRINSRNQAEGISQINDAVNEISQVTNDTTVNADMSAGASRQARKAMKRMRDVVRELSGLVAAKNGASKKVAHIRPSEAENDGETRNPLRRLFDRLRHGLPFQSRKSG